MHWTGDHAWTCLRSNCCQSVLLAISEEWRGAFDRGTMHGPVKGLTIISLFVWLSLRNGDVHWTGDYAWTCLRSNCCLSVFLSMRNGEVHLTGGSCIDLSKD